MAEQNLSFDEVFRAPRERVFAWFAHHENLARLWGGRFRRIKDGVDPLDPDGLGSVREIRAGTFRFEETIVTYQPHQLIEYQVTRGGPIKNHLGRLAFSDVPGGTRIEYTIRFDGRVPGTGGLLAATLRLSWKLGFPKVVRELDAA